MAERLLEQLPGAVIAYDPEPDSLLKSPWRTYRHAIQAAPVDATHILVIQEDATPCRGFHQALSRVVAARPDRIIVLCVCGNAHYARGAVQQACERGQSWAELPRAQILPVVATVWPAETARELVAWVDEQGWHEKFAADDERTRHFLDAQQLVACATVPSLVDHEDMIPSLMSRRQRYGTDPARRAFLFIDRDCDCDVAQIDWS